MTITADYSPRSVVILCDHRDDLGRCPWRTAGTNRAAALRRAADHVAAVHDNPQAARTIRQRAARVSDNVQ